MKNKGQNRNFVSLHNDEEKIVMARSLKFPFEKSSLRATKWGGNPEIMEKTGWPRRDFVPPRHDENLVLFFIIGKRYLRNHNEF